MMRTTVSTQPQIIIVVCCITLRRSAYDTAGNIRSITKDGAVIKSFGYTNPSWPDLLTSVTSGSTTKDILYEGQTQTSDLPASGNPVTYYNGKDYTFTWTKGRQLASATVDGKQISYTYDMSGVRTSKTVDGTTYNYTTLSGKVMRQTWGNKSLEFVYDDGSQPFAMIYKHGSETELYYYLVNAQGDVSAILDSGGKIAASYDYDAWGNCTVYDSSDAAIGDLNPLRYRGYYYDAETGFYYLQSRYYDPAICRFINADTFATTDANGLLSANMFAYCENNPIMRTDEDGEVSHIVIGAVVGLVISSAIELGSQLRAGESLRTVDWKSVGIAAASGLIGGAFAATGLGLGWQVSINAALGAASYMANTLPDGKCTVMGVIENAVIGGGAGLIGGKGANGKEVVSTLKYVREGITREARRANRKYAAKRIATYSAQRTRTTRGVYASTARFSLGAFFAKWATSRKWW